MRKKTTEDFVTDARRVHGDRYGYEKVVYKNCMKKVTITCAIHGDFEQRPNDHLKGKGCPKCGGSERSDTESFVKRAIEIHGKRYSYDKVVYSNSREKVTITCPEHGDFEQRPNGHLKGHGCPKCSGTERSDTESFVKRAVEIHGEKYNYDRVVYTTNHKKVIITCPVHGDFEQTANKHLSGHGCAKCGGSERSDTESFVKRAVEIHGEKYNYDRVVYTTNNKKVIITCPEHGDFEQRPGGHLDGKGCSECRDDSRRSDTESFVKRAVEVHGDKYSYEKVVYTTNNKKVIITCPEHGDFEQRPNGHLSGKGCPKCQKQWSGDGAVYVMSSPEGYNKIGIAKSGTEHNRLTQILKSQQTKAPTAITGLSLVCAYSFNDGSFTEARRFEGKAHRHFKDRRKIFTDKFFGYSEFFTVPVSEICSYLEQQGGKLVTIRNV